jgi:hypothetical protein
MNVGLTVGDFPLCALHGTELRIWVRVSDLGSSARPLTQSRVHTGPLKQMSLKILRQIGAFWRVY